MLSSNYFKALAVLTVLGLMLANCAPTPASPSAKSVSSPVKAADATPTTVQPDAPTPTPKSEGTQPRYGGILTRSHTEDPPTLDIHQELSANAHLSLANVYNGLVRFDTVDLDKVAPELADSWEVSPDGKSFTFKVHPGVKWQDGTPLTVDDVKFSLERMAFWKEHRIVSPRGGAMLRLVEKVEAPDSSTVKITLKSPSGAFMRNMASGWVLIMPKHVIQAKGDMKKDAVGSGAFKWKGISPGVVVDLVKNEDFFVRGLPYLDGIRIFTIKDDATRLAAFRTGRIKMTGIASRALTHAQAEMVKKELSDKVQVVTHSAVMRSLIFTNIKKTPWNDVRVRKAVDLAFDRQAAIKINFGKGMIGGAFDPSGMWGIEEKEMVKKPGYRQPKEPDLEQALKEMAEAGYANGFKTRMLVNAGGLTESRGVVARDQLARIGIQVELEVLDGGSVQARLNKHDFDMTSNNRSDPGDDPDVFASYFVTGGSTNYGEFSDSRIDELFEKQSSILDVKERQKVAFEIQERLLELAPMSIVFWDMYNLGFWQDVKGYMPGRGAYSHNNLDHVWLSYEKSS